jgi:hypothetical protein
MLSLSVVLMMTGSLSAENPTVLLRSVPMPVNSVVVINVASLLNSPRAMKDGWSKLEHTEYLAGAVPVHPSVERILLAKELHPAAPTRGGVLAVIPLRKELDLKRYATAFNGEMTTIAGEPAVVGKNGSYSIALGPKTLGSMIAENRQDVSRWIRCVKDKPTKSLQSTYLNGAVNAEGMKPHIFLVVDTEDLFEDKHAGFLVAISEVLKGKLNESQGIEAYLKGLRGLRLSATITAEGIDAVLQFDGKAKPKVEAPLIKAFVVELFERNGARLEDLVVAKVTVNEGAVQFAFKLTDSELGNIMAMFLPPMSGLAESDSIPITPIKEVNATSSGKYYRAVNAILDDLRKQNQRATQFQQTALWHETAANRLEVLSVLGVDPLLIEYGHGTAARLRAVADSLRGTPIKATILESKAYLVTYTPPPAIWVPGRGLQWNPWALAGQGNQLETNIPQVRQAILEEARKDAENRTKLWNSIDSQRSEIRYAMAKKYGSEFEATGKK